MNSIASVVIVILIVILMLFVIAASYLWRKFTDVCEGNKGALGYEHYDENLQKNREEFEKSLSQDKSLD